MSQKNKSGFYKQIIEEISEPVETSVLAIIWVVIRFLLLCCLNVIGWFYISFGTGDFMHKVLRINRLKMNENNYYFLETSVATLFFIALSWIIYCMPGMKRNYWFPDILIPVFNAIYIVALWVSIF